MTGAFAFESDAELLPKPTMRPVATHKILCFHDRAHSPDCRVIGIQCHAALTTGGARVAAGTCISSPRESCWRGFVQLHSDWVGGVVFDSIIINL
jgi:hypothetical protein